jgi:hypothetical protein
MNASRHQHTPPFSTRFETRALDWSFRFGFASVFLINALIAWLEPGGFVKLMQGGLLGQVIDDFKPFVWLIGLNDGLLALLILWGRARAWVLAWSGLWLLAVTLIKLSDLLR